MIFWPDWALLVGSGTELELQPSADGTALAGSAAPSLDPGEGATVATGALRSSGLHDVISLTPSGAGEHPLSVTYADGSSFSWTVSAVEQPDTLVVNCGGQAEELGVGYCVAEAGLDNGTIVYGAAATWSESDSELEGSGDLLEWTPASIDNPPGVSVQAQFGELVADGEHMGAAGSATVTSSNDVSICGLWQPGALWLGLPAFGLLGLRRRRHASR